MKESWEFLTHQQNLNLQLHSCFLSRQGISEDTSAQILYVN